MRKVKRSKTFGRKAKPNKLGFTEFEIATLEVHPGDILVLRTDMHISREQADHLKRIAEDMFPGIPIAVLAGGISLAVVQDKTKEDTMGDPKDRPSQQPVPPANPPGTDGADHVEDFREGEVETPVDAPPPPNRPTPAPHQD